MTVNFVREVTLKYRGNKGATFDAAKSPTRSAGLIRRVLPDNVREHFVALLVNVHMEVVGYYVVATGTGSSCPVGTREICQAAVTAGAHAIVVGHNPPAGGGQHTVADLTCAAGAPSGGFT